jgi:hypothetical protein
MQQWCSEAQRRLRDRHGVIVVPRTRAHLRALARWWEIEAMRGDPASERSREYAANMRWLVELLDAGHKVFGRRFEAIVKEHRP